MSEDSTSASKLASTSTIALHFPHFHGSNLGFSFALLVTAMLFQHLACSLAHNHILLSVNALDLEVIQAHLVEFPSLVALLTSVLVEVSNASYCPPPPLPLPPPPPLPLLRRRCPFSGTRSGFSGSWRLL